MLLACFQTGKAAFKCSYFAKFCLKSTCKSSQAYSWPFAHGTWPLAPLSWPLGPGSWPLALGPWPLAPGPWPLAPGSWPGSWPGLWLLAPGTWPWAPQLVQKQIGWILCLLNYQRYYNWRFWQRKVVNCAYMNVP